MDSCPHALCALRCWTTRPVIVLYVKWTSTTLSAYLESSPLLYFRSPTLWTFVPSVPLALCCWTTRHMRVLYVRWT